ncbi:MAG: DUF4214 domain-containing protein [Protaetiibacter sp.]
MTRRRLTRIVLAFLTAVGCVLGVVSPAAAADSPVTLTGSAVLRASTGSIAVLTQRWTSADGWADEIQTTTTDAAGNYSVTLEMGYYRIHFVPLIDGYRDEYYNDNYAPPTPTLFISSRTLDPVMLLPTFTGHGTVQLESVGAAGSGQASVTLTPIGAPGLAPATAVTDASGGWQVEDLVATDYTVKIQLTGETTHAPYVGNVGAIALGRGLDATLARINTISGSVVIGPTARPAEAGEVTVTLQRSVNGGMFLEVATTQTDATGNYSFGGLASVASTRYYVCANGSDRILGDCVLSPRIFTLEGADVTENLQLGLAGSVSGAVTATGGEPLVGIHVTSDLYLNATDPSPFSTTESTSGADGTWSIDPAHEGYHDIYFVDETGVYAPVNLDGSSYYLAPSLLRVGRSQVESGYTVRMPRAGAISGRIGGLTAQQRLEGTVEIELLIRTGSTWVRTGYVWPASTDDGSYVVGGLTPGDYRLDVTYHGPDGTSIATSPALTLPEGAQRIYSPVLGERTFLRQTTAFVRALYADFLGRAPSPSDLRYWASSLESGVPRSAIVQGFATSDEYRLIRIDAAYQGILGRPAESSGRLWWLGQMRAGMLTTDDIERQFFGSAEYARSAEPVCARIDDQTGWARIGIGPGGVPYVIEPDYHPPAFVRCLYYDLMGREPDAAGLTYWSTRAVEHGRQSVVDQLWRSPEVAGARVSSMYAMYLGRTPDAKGLTFWTSYILSQGDTTTRASITESDEYFRLASERFPEG